MHLQIVKHAPLILLFTAAVWAKRFPMEGDSGYESPEKSPPPEESSTTEPPPTANEAENSPEAVADHLKIYQRLFNMKRKQQLEAVKTIAKIEDPDKQIKLVESLLQTMEKTIQESRLEIEKNHFIPGETPFPSAEDKSLNPLRESLSKVLENAAFFAELALRIPEITSKYYKTNNQFQLTANWGLGFSNSTGFYDSVNTKLMYLVGQELRLSERDPDYVNPYRKKKAKELIKEAEKLAAAAKEKQKKEKKPKKKRGPGLSGASKTEL